MHPLAPGDRRSWTDRLLDRSVVLSFDRTGFERHQKRFRAEDLAVDLRGKVILVTGASSGLGEAAARSLAARGAEVWLLCRSRQRGLWARQRIAAATGNRHLRVAEVDLADAGSIQRFVSGAAPEVVDVLINNAGVLLGERSETREGLERTFATNLIGPARLTSGLLQRLSRASDPRVINVSSGGMYPVRLQVADPQWRRRPFDGVRAYAETKRGLVVMTELWAGGWSQTGVLFHSMHPGWADTPGVRNSLPRFWSSMRHRLRSAEQGADTMVWLSVAPADRLGSGRFWFDRQAVSTHLLPWTRESDGERREFRELWEELSVFGGREELVA